jgi:hypothetical protein
MMPERQHYHIPQRRGTRQRYIEFRDAAGMVDQQ